MTKFDLTQQDFLEKNDKSKTPDQLSDYVEDIKKAKELLKESEEKLLKCTDENERRFILEDIKEAERDLKGYDLRRENLTVAEDNAFKETEFRNSISEPVYENVFVKELKEDHPERMDLFNNLMGVINAGGILKISNSTDQRQIQMSNYVVNENDLALALINYEPEEERFYFKPKMVASTHPLRKNQSLIGFKFNSDYIEKFKDTIADEEKRTLYPVLKSDDDAEQLFGKDYEYEIYFCESEIGSDDYNEINKKCVAHVEKGEFITIFMFVNKINMDTILENSCKSLGFDPIHDQYVDITDIKGNLLNTIDIPEYLLFSIATITDDQEIALTINKNRNIEFKIRDKRPIFASGKDDLAVAIPRNFKEMCEYGKELKYPYHYNLPGIGIVSPNVTDGKVRLEHPSRSKLTYEMSKIVDWRKSDNQFSDREYPPQKQIEIMVDMNNIPELPPCKRAVPIPYIDPKGKCHYMEGYDEENQILQFHAEQINFKKVSNVPTKEEILKSKIILHEPFAEFPFVNESDYTNFISLILTPFLSTVIPDALKPSFCIKAADVGNGKTLSAECAARIFSKNYIVSNIAGDEAELDRKFLSLLSCFPDAIIFDNINKLDSPSLAQNMTSPHYSGRQIGTSKTLVLPNNATIIMTGNNPELSKEITRRTVFISLNAKMENSEYGRTFKIKYLDKYIEEHRADLIWACLTLIKSWFSAGKPKDKNFKPMGSFEEWSITMAGILANAGYKGFLDNRESERQIVDAESIGWRILISSIYTKFGSNKITTADIYNIAKDIDGVNIQGKNPNECKKHLAKQLSKNLNKVYGDYMLAEGGMSHNSRVWVIQKLKPQGIESDEQTAWKKNPLR